MTEIGITDDLKQRKLMPLKVLFFVHASTILVLYPYLTIHMRELGINVEETAIMSAVTPVVFFIMPPLAGLLADKIGNFRLLLAIFSSLGGFAALLLLLVPVGRVTITYPSEVELLTSCQSGNLTLQNIQEYPCLSLENNLQHTNFTLLSCGFVCEVPSSISKENLDLISQKQFYDIYIRSKQNISQLIYRHSITIPEAYTTEAYDKSTSRVLTNDGYFDKKIRKFSDRQLFFPSPDLYAFDCETSGSNSACYFGTTEMNYGINGTSMVYVTAEEIVLSVELKPQVNNNTYKVSSLKNTGFDDNKGVVCNDNYNQEDGRVRVLAGGYEFSECSSACASRVPRKLFCSNLKHRKDLDPSLTFWTYLVVRMFIGIISGTAFAMFEGAVISVIRDQRADYGLQRAYGSIGGMISSPLSGLLIDYASRGKSYTDFRPAFYLYAVLKVASGALMLSIDLEFKQPAQNLMKDVVTVFKNIEMIALFIACFVMGTAWGYIESFLFWLLKDMNASSSLMGFTVTVGGVAGLPLLVFSGPIIQKLGHANVLFIGFVFYAIRLLGYSLIYNPWLCLIFEAMESVTSSLSFTAAVTYAAKLSSTSTDTSVQGLLGGVYYGIGKGAGSLVGGFLMKYFGTRLTYQIFSIFTLITGCIYFLFNKFYIRKRITSSVDNEICPKKKLPADVECTNYIKKDPLDVIKYVDGSVLHNVDLSDNEKAPEVDHTTKCKNIDNIDGSSDSGVDNPVYSESETPNETKK